MTVQVRIFDPPNTLAKVLQSDHGRSFGDLVTAADIRVGRLAPGLKAYVAEQLERLVDICSQGEEALFCRSPEVGEAAMNVAEVAAAAGLSPIGEVARGIRAMIDGLTGQGIWHTDALTLHICSLALLNQASAPGEAETEVMLLRLKDLRATIGVVE